MNFAIALALLILFGLLTLVSYVDRVYSEIGKFLSREFQENIDSFEQQVEPKLGVSRDRAALSMAVLAQLITVAIAMVVAFTVFRDRAWSIWEILQATLSLILVVIIFNRFLPFVLFSRTKGLWLALAGVDLRPAASDLSAGLLTVRCGPDQGTCKRAT
jgi:ABC-type spermidine/putrescine transport system permease subunit I